MKLVTHVMKFLPLDVHQGIQGLLGEEGIAQAYSDLVAVVPGNVELGHLFAGLALANLDFISMVLQPPESKPNQNNQKLIPGVMLVLLKLNACCLVEAF